MRYIIWPYIMYQVRHWSTGMSVRNAMLLQKEECCLLQIIMSTRRQDNVTHPSLFAEWLEDAGWVPTSCTTCRAIQVSQKPWYFNPPNGPTHGPRPKDKNPKRSWKQSRVCSCRVRGSHNNIYINHTVGGGTLPPGYNTPLHLHRIN